MTEREWLTCSDPSLMLTELAGRVSERKLRLFAVACCRHIWHLLEDPLSRAAVEVAERYADGLADLRELAAAKAVAAKPKGGGATAAHWVVCPNLPGAIVDLCDAAVSASAENAAPSMPKNVAEANAWDVAYRAAQARGAQEQAHHLREVLGNPFRPSPGKRGWLTWRGGLLRSMARQIYDSGNFSDLPVLADALEDAGCSDADLLAHCRDGGAHVRGCWALDLLLEQE